MNNFSKQQLENISRSHKQFIDQVMICNWSVQVKDPLNVPLNVFATQHKNNFFEVLYLNIFIKLLVHFRILTIDLRQI